jgi:hypothetical protein
VCFAVSYCLTSCDYHKLTFSTSLFRPYIKLDLRGANLFPRDTCTFCANEISGLSNALRAMYGLRRVCLPVTGFLLSASTIHLLNLPSETSGRHLSQAMHDLQAMSTNHVFAARCVDIIRSLASKWKISLPEDAPSKSPSKQNGRTTGSPKSAFYSASIPRQNSSQSGTRSADSLDSRASNPAKHESPFAPPAPSSHPQDSNSNQNSGYYSDQFPSMDQMSMQQQAYWLPFPVQSMPNAQLADLQQSTAMQTPNSLSYLDSSAEQQWQQQYSGMHTSTVQQHLANQFQSRNQQQQQQTPMTVGGRTDEHMDNSYDNWHWQ